MFLPNNVQHCSIRGWKVYLKTHRFKCRSYLISVPKYERTLMTPFKHLDYIILAQMKIVLYIKTKLLVFLISKYTLFTEYGKLKSSWVIHFFLSEYLMSNKAYSLKKILICRHMTLGSGGGSVCQILFYWLMKFLSQTDLYFLFKIFIFFSSQIFFWNKKKIFGSITIKQ